MPKAGITYSTKKIDATDYKALREREEGAVKEELGRIARPDDRIERAAEIIRQADAEIALHLEDRDKAVASLWFFEHVKGLARTIGVTATAYREILSKAYYGGFERRRTASGHFELRPVPDVPGGELVKLAEEAGVPRVENASEDLPRLARVVAAARARRGAAVVFMREAALALMEEPYGWDAEKIAEHAGVGKKLIYQQTRTARLTRER
ncbi:hypothetical protein [Streptomyces cahuitamycinicus]|uniref:Uncharacterized protein n=1 Tax=Streptomyces cahuitamycinicus TaxID=2070367 RepID=A0A2N8TTH2_9ACTN|nr:hypothetical protein [Streptomyces cahuitamycinicus]PNG22324.1 hypothetical protein C1J00_09930 [Streptomyces cahuitamycinicus]